MKPRGWRAFWPELVPVARVRARVRAYCTLCKHDGTRDHLSTIEHRRRTYAHERTILGDAMSRPSMIRVSLDRDAEDRYYDDLAQAELRAIR